MDLDKKKKELKQEFKDIHKEIKRLEIRIIVIVGQYDLIKEIEDGDK